MPSATPKHVISSPVAGDQRLVLPSGGGPGPDQAPEGGQAATEAPQRYVHTTFQLLPRCAPPTMASPLLPSWVAAPVPVFCGSCHPSYDQTMGPGTLHEYLLECRCQAASCSCTFIYLVRLFFERAIGLTPRGSAPPLAHGGMASGASYMPLPRVSGLRIPWLPC